MVTYHQKNKNKLATSQTLIRKNQASLTFHAKKSLQKKYNWMISKLHTKMEQHYKNLN